MRPCAKSYHAVWGGGFGHGHVSSGCEVAATGQIGETDIADERGMSAARDSCNSQRPDGALRGDLPSAARAACAIGKIELERSERGAIYRAGCQGPVSWTVGAQCPVTGLSAGKPWE